MILASSFRAALLEFIVPFLSVASREYFCTNVYAVLIRPVTA
jgi:hypothetical protein